jgi:signal transduction histidine kinase
MTDSLMHGSKFDYAAIEHRLANHRSRILFLATLPSILVFLLLAAWFKSLVLTANNVVFMALTITALFLLERGYSRLAKLMFLIPANLTIFAFADSAQVSTGVHMFYIPALLLPLACFPRAQYVYGIALSILSATLWFIQLYYPAQLIYPPVDGLMQLSPMISAVGVASILAAFFYLGFREFARLLIESETAKAESMQKSRLAAIGELSSDIAHEVNNPLAIISLKSQKILDRIEETPHLPQEFRDEILRDTSKIVSVCQRIAKIINGLRVISRADFSEDLESVSLRLIIEQTLEITQDQWRDLHFELIVDAEGPIDCRPVQISQVLINLIHNAEYATRGQQDRWIRIQTHDRGEDWLIEVMDSGPAISAEAKQKLTQPFFTTKPPGVGTGLGLSISRRIVERHGGRLALDVDRRETCFQIFLPKPVPRTQEIKS